MGLLTQDGGQGPQGPGHPPAKAQPRPSGRHFSEQPQPANLEHRLTAPSLPSRGNHLSFCSWQSLAIPLPTGPQGRLAL